MPHLSRQRPIAAFAAAVLLGALLRTAAPAAAADPAPDLLPVGAPAPMFESIDTEGAPFSLAEALKQGPAMIVFWSLFCASCMEELPLIEQEQAKFAGKVQVFAVNLDEAPRAKTVKGFSKQQGFTLRMLLNKVEGREFNIDGAFKIKATPALYLVNRDGTIAYGHYGPLNPDELAEVVKKAR
jgi:thiol-disulfide isomerase/thioredoxin